jgi:hypothetical protein
MCSLPPNVRYMYYLSHLRIIMQKNEHEGLLGHTLVNLPFGCHPSRLMCTRPRAFSIGERWYLSYRPNGSGVVRENR